MGNGGSKKEGKRVSENPGRGLEHPNASGGEEIRKQKRAKEQAQLEGLSNR